jgi:hypothetical protein
MDDAADRALVDIARVGHGEPRIAKIVVAGGPIGWALALAMGFDDGGVFHG